MATYDLQPKMAAEPVADAIVREIEAGTHSLLICNLAPPDMVSQPATSPLTYTRITLARRCYRGADPALGP